MNTNLQKNHNNKQKQKKHSNNKSINDLNDKSAVASINYMYPQTKTDYDHYYEINSHMNLNDTENNNDDMNNLNDNHMQNEKSTVDDQQDNKIKNLVDEITNNIDNMESMGDIYEYYENNDNKKNNNKNSPEKSCLTSYLSFKKWKDPLIVFVIYVIMSLPVVQSFLGKYIKQIVPDPMSCNVSMYGAVIYGFILMIVFFVIKNDLLFKH